jgi:hypothetical protein
LRINSVRASLDSTRFTPPAARTLKTPIDAAKARRADESTTAPGFKGRAHGVIKKLGADHFSPAVEAKLTARFAPERLVSPTSDPAADPLADPVSDPASGSATDPQPIPAGETPSDLVPLPDGERAPTTQIDDTVGAGAPDPQSRDGILTRDVTSAFANFNLFDVTQATRIDLIA